MKAKLIKTGNEYLLRHENGKVLAISNGGKEGKKLSLKNCEAIERDYDLDEIIEQTKLTLEDSRISSYDSFRIGMETILKILGDKKFSENDIRNAWDTALNQYLMFHEIPATAWREQHIQSLQQNEWDVEICCHIDDHGTGNGSEDSFSHPMFTNTGIPKLDANGCLILKLK